MMFQNMGSSSVENNIAAEFAAKVAIAAAGEDTISSSGGATTASRSPALSAVVEGSTEFTPRGTVPVQTPVQVNGPSAGQSVDAESNPPPTHSILQ